MRALPSAYTLWTRLLRLWDCLAATKTRLGVEALEDRVVPAPLIPYPVILAGAGAGEPVVRSFDALTGDLNFERAVFEPEFTGGVRVATADFTGDGYPDAVVSAGDGGGPRVLVLDGKTGEPLPGPLGGLMAFAADFRGGVNVAAADVDGDGTPDVVAAAGGGGGPHVVAFSGKDGSVLASFYALDPGFAGGVSVAAADFTGDGKAEVVIGAGEGGGPRVTVLDALSGRTIDGPLGSFFAFDPDFRGGVTVGTDSLAGDVTGDGVPDVLAGAGPGMGSLVRVFDGRTGELAREFSPFGPGDVSGVRVAVAYIDGDRQSDVVVGTGPGAAARVRTFSGATGEVMPGPVGDFLPFGDGMSDGVFVAASNDPLNPSLTWSSVDPGSTVVGQAVELKVGLTGQTVSGTDYIPSGQVTFSAIDTTTSATYTLGTAAVVTVNPTLLTAEARLVAGSLPAGTYTLRAYYPGTGDKPTQFQGATVDYSSSFTVSAAPSDAPANYYPAGAGAGGWALAARKPPPIRPGVTPTFLVHPPPPETPGGTPTTPGESGTPETGGTGTGGTGAGGTGAGGAAVDFWPGAVVVGQTDLASAGFGTPWDQDWTWTNVPGYADGLVGDGATQGQSPHLVQVNGDDSIAVVPDPTTTHFFDLYGGAYRPRFSDVGTLTHDTTNHVFVETDADGTALTYNDFSSSVPVGRRGRLVSAADPAGNLTSVTSWDSGGGPAEVQRMDGSGSTARTESYVYTYDTSTDNAGLVASATRRRRVGTGSWETLGAVEYAYYASTDTHGTPHHLKTATVKDAGGTVTDVSYYRWYTTGSSAGLMSHAFGPAAYARLTAALGTGVDALSDTQVAPYADRAFTWDSAGRVATETDAGAGNDGGRGTYSYAYATNSGSSGQAVPNEWQVRTTVTLPDGNTARAYANAFGRVMLATYAEGSQTWLWFRRYDDRERLTLSADPSAVTGFSESNGDLVGYSGANAAYLSDSDGLLTAYTYAASTTATSSAAGDAAGFLKEVGLKHGETGTPVKQESATYIGRTAGGVDYFFPAADTVYRDADGTGGQTTTTTYAWQGSTAQPASVTVTLPAVTTGQNGSGTADAATAVFDTYGRVEWARDGGGFLGYAAYDVVTGSATKTIDDVDTTRTSDFTDLPSGWGTPSGGGLHLITSDELDGRGRVTKETSPAGRVTYLVYNDPGHEVRAYPGWGATANAPTGPTVVLREDRAGNYTEALTMSATPAVASGRPTGGETIDQVQSLSRVYRNDAGQTVYSDAYFDLGGLTYTASASLGTSGVNFYRTTVGYDAGGRPDRAVSPQGTITRMVYDGQGRLVSEWVGTDDAPTSGAWSPTNPTGTDVVDVREYEYDGGGVGDGNPTRVTEHPGLSQPDRVTEAYYDWRDRAVAVKAGVETSESTDVNRPILYQTYDNLGEVTQARVYDGDGVTIGFTSGVPDAPSASLLRSQSATSYDELGQAYRSDTSSVDPSSGSVGTDTLYALAWYDGRGNVVKTLAPGGLVEKTSYDGAGRPTAVYTTDGGGDSAYADADDVSGDTVLEQAAATYDADGNALTTVARQRFHDATGTGALGTPSSGVGARVSYAGSYFDNGGRPTAAVDVGTNGGSAWTRPSSAPSRSDTALVTSAAYAADAVQVVRLTGSPAGGTFTLTFGGQTTSGIASNASASAVQSALAGLSSVGTGNVVVTAAAGGGWEVRFAGSLGGHWQAKLTASGSGLTGGTSPAVAVSTVSLGGDAGNVVDVTDPRGLVARTYSDPLGRVVQTVQDFTDGAVTDASNKTTDYAYNAAGLTSLTAELTGGGGQTTAWVYGVTTTASGVASNDVVGATRWPDASTGAASGSEQETVTVNALGEVVTATDRNGSVHAYTRDVLGRVVSDAVTTLGSGVDGAVRRIETAYDGQGNPYLVTSYDAASGGSVVNQVQRAYNGLGQVTAEWQEHGGAVNTSTSPEVQYAYAEMPSGANHSRLTSVTYPSGYVLTYNYSSGLNSTISRLSSLSDSTGTLESYSYLGLGTVVIRSHPQPGIDLTYVKQGSESVGDAGDQYTGLDRFGRVADQRWIKTSTGTATDRFQYGYDRDSNALFRDNLVNTGFGELYTYDDLNQLASFARGTLNSGRTAISGAATRTQAWDHDALGNFDSVTTNGTAETRSANA